MLENDILSPDKVKWDQFGNSQVNNLAALQQEDIVQNWVPLQQKQLWFENLNSITRHHNRLFHMTQDHVTANRLFFLQQKIYVFYV